ncbi:hypothetical protein DFS34DRAFT_377875, partial [Phlyctochytrium arcticum]
FEDLSHGRFKRKYGTELKLHCKVAQRSDLPAHRGSCLLDLPTEQQTPTVDNGLFALYLLFPLPKPKPHAQENCHGPSFSAPLRHLPIPPVPEASTHTQHRNRRRHDWKADTTQCWHDHIFAPDAVHVPHARSANVAHNADDDWHGILLQRCALPWRLWTKHGGSERPYTATGSASQVRARQRSNSLFRLPFPGITCHAE